MGLSVVSKKVSSMRYRSQVGSFPSLTESILAAALGILIGVAVTNFIHRHSDTESISTSAEPSTLSTTGDSTPAPQSSLPNFSLLPKLDHRMNILLMGVDSNGRNTQRFLNTRSDTMMVVSVDPDARKVGVVSIPRDSRVPIAGGHGEDKINSAHAFGGPDLAVETVQQNFNVPIDRYVVVDVQGLKRLFEILGPIEVLVEKKMYYTDRAAGLNIALKPGLQTLDATQAEEYVRFRHDAKGDIGRIDRQQWFLRQVSKKLQDPQILFKLPDLYQCATDYVETNLTVDEMARLVAFGKDVKMSDIQTAMVPGRATTIKGGSYWIPEYSGATLVFNRLCGAPMNTWTGHEHFGDADSSAVQAAESPDVAPVVPDLSKPLSVSIKYSKGSEDSAKNLEAQLLEAGFRVRNRYRADLAECQHEQIVQQTNRAALDNLDELRERLPFVAEFPVVVNLDYETSTDLVMVIAPDTNIPPVAVPEAPSTDEESKAARAKL
jgi:LCP family protein required for cell wall assembly